jgi:hypothetical protein
MTEWIGVRELGEREAALGDEGVVTERCAHCPDFAIEGPLRAMREQFRAHVAEHHPHLLVALDAKRRPRSIPPTREPEHVLLRRLDMIAAAV